MKKTTILWIIIVLLTAIVAWLVTRKPNTVVIDPVPAKDSTVSTSVQSVVKNTSSTSSTTKTAVKPVAPYNLSFFKVQLQQMPDSIISQCTISGRTYFAANFNKYNAQDGMYAVGGGTEIYSPDGTLTASCLPNNRSDFCAAYFATISSCKDVYSVKTSQNHQSIDTYHINN